MNSFKELNFLNVRIVDVTFQKYFFLCTEG
jgi:hypothetical protein